MSSGGAVTDVDDFGDRPLDGTVPTGGEDGANGIIEGFAALGLFANSEIGDEPEHRAAPVGPSPTVSAIQTAVPGLGEAGGHSGEGLAPELIDGHIAKSGTGDRLQVGGEPFVHPHMLFIEVGEGEVEHLVGEGPVGVEKVGFDIGPDGNLDELAVVGDTSLNFRPRLKMDMQVELMDGEVAEIIFDGRRGGVNPAIDICFGQRSEVTFIEYINDTAGELERFTGFSKVGEGDGLGMGAASHRDKSEEVNEGCGSEHSESLGGVVGKKRARGGMSAGF